jgi:hypothetical protein
MLKSFTVRNFRSFHEQVHISLALNKHTPDDNRSFISPAGTKLSKVLAVSLATDAHKYLNSLSHSSFTVHQDFLKISIKLNADKAQIYELRKSTEQRRSDLHETLRNVENFSAKNIA